MAHEYDDGNDDADDRKEESQKKKKLFEVKWFGSVSCSANANMLQ